MTGRICALSLSRAKRGEGGEEIMARKREKKVLVTHDSTKIR